ncbi:cyclase family protein [Bacteroidota bacterium]
MSKQRIIDVTMAMHPSLRGFYSSKAKSMKEDGWNASTYEIYSHAGTHMDAPLHFDVSSKSIDQIDPERLICQCHIIRLTGIEPAELINIDHLGQAAEKIRAGEAVIFHTGWSNYKDDLQLYRNRLPRISLELSAWLARRKVNLVGVEPPSIADVNNLTELQAVHSVLLQADILILEGLCNLEEVRKDYVTLVALPLKITGGDGAPVRALILEN